jgi:4-hydroxy-3-methylbut-2-enyl diphosphate reductase
MNVKLAENYGFCFGVKRAIKIAEENIGSSTYGPLIHNSKEIDRLKEDFKVSLVEDISTFKAGERRSSVPMEYLKTNLPACMKKTLT